MIETKKLKLKFADLLTHYLIVLFCMIPFFLTLYSFVEKYILHNYTGVRSPEEMLVASSIFGLIGIAFFFVQKSKLKFKIIETNLSKENLKEIINRTANELEWHTEIANDKIIVAKTHPKWWTGSWGERITIVFDKSSVMINSICDPSKKASVASFGRNRKNVNRLLENISTASR
ncbi:MAG: hypothetical protein CFE23_16400 [Flavobacterium sp. BFFFF1]|nr:MAG: hypothetical protein CFE23_16400 [Flavobacterium sp. BFFFF1]